MADGKITIEVCDGVARDAINAHAVNIQELRDVDQKILDFGESVSRSLDQVKANLEREKLLAACDPVSREKANELVAFTKDQEKVNEWMASSLRQMNQEKAGKWVEESLRTLVQDFIRLEKFVIEKSAGDGAVWVRDSGPQPVKAQTPAADATVEVSLVKGECEAIADMEIALHKLVSADYLRLVGSEMCYEGDVQGGTQVIEEAVKLTKQARELKIVREMTAKMGRPVLR